MAEEGRFGTGALSRSAELALFNPSRQLGRARWSRSSCCMLVTMLLSYLVGLLVALPFQLPMFIDMFRKATAGERTSCGVMASWVWLQMPAQFLTSLASTAIYVYIRLRHRPALPRRARAAGGDRPPGGDRRPVPAPRRRRRS